ncbi:hypothetical protein TYRP_018876 [Tyrophagus putrescentiae]|nr:hypothetical protein TYRP_018876 [Tyrophagus putrescentiae]
MLPIISLDSCSSAANCVQLEGGGKARGRASVKSHPVSECLTYSQQSILCAMDRFVKSVHNMDATVLLRDMETTTASSAAAAAVAASAALQRSPARVPSALANADLHSFYLMLNSVKKELLWGPGTVLPTTTSHAFVVRNESLERSSSVASSRSSLKHSRQCSDDSLGSLGSTASSSTSDTDSEADSMITDRDSTIDDHTSHLSVAFRHHLQGLHSILHQLADSADYLSTRYQEEIDASLL